MRSEISTEYKFLSVANFQQILVILDLTKSILIFYAVKNLFNSLFKYIENFNRTSLRIVFRQPQFIAAPKREIPSIFSQLHNLPLTHSLTRVSFFFFYSNKTQTRLKLTSFRIIFFQ